MLIISEDCRAQLSVGCKDGLGDTNVMGSLDLYALQGQGGHDLLCLVMQAILYWILSPLQVESWLALCDLQQ